MPSSTSQNLNGLGSAVALIKRALKMAGLKRPAAI